MAIVKVPHLGRTFIMPAQIEIFLAGVGVEYHRWTPAVPLSLDAPATQILSSYATELENHKRARGFAAYDVIELTPETPGLDEMLARFRQEHWHDEDEAHLIVAGRGVCHIHAVGRPVVMVELEPGDFLSVGREIRHWFDLCSERCLRAIRFLSQSSHIAYTQSGIEADYEPVCLGPAYFAYRQHRKPSASANKAA